MSKIRRKEDRHRLVSMLEEYRKEKCLSPRNCKVCTFSINNNGGCALNLVIHCIDHGLSLYKEEADAQWKELLYGKQVCLDQMVAYAESRKKSKEESSQHVSLKDICRQMDPPDIDITKLNDVDDLV